MHVDVRVINEMEIEESRHNDVVVQEEFSSEKALKVLGRKGANCKGLHDTAVERLLDAFKTVSNLTTTPVSSKIKL